MACLLPAASLSRHGGPTPRFHCPHDVASPLRLPVFLGCVLSRLYSPLPPGSAAPFSPLCALFDTLCPTVTLFHCSFTFARGPLLPSYPPCPLTVYTLCWFVRALSAFILPPVTRSGRHSRLLAIPFLAPCYCRPCLGLLLQASARAHLLPLFACHSELFVVQLVFPSARLLPPPALLLSLLPAGFVASLQYMCFSTQTKSSPDYHRVQLFSLPCHAVGLARPV